MQRLIYLLVLGIFFGTVDTASARRHEINPTDLVVIRTTKVFAFSGLLYDDKVLNAVVIFEGCESTNGTTCDDPHVWTGTLVTVTLTATTCRVRKGDAKEEVCANSAYTISDLETDIDTNAKGLGLGAAAAFTAGYGN